MKKQNPNALVHLVVYCPDCCGIEMASTRESMSRLDWYWVGKMYETGWQTKGATAEEIRGSDFGCKCHPRRIVVSVD